jgi:O-antigen/teichoic acid export membrane protein
MIAVALLPVFVRAHGRDPALFESSWHTGMRAVLLVSLPLSLVACVLARPIVVRLFGAGFSAAAPALSILVWSSPLWAVNMALTGALRGAGREAWLWSVTGAGAVVNVGLNLWAVPALGIEGAAAVTVATEATVLAALWGLALRRGILPWPRLPHWQLALALASLGGVALVTRTLPVEVSAPTSLAAYVVTLAATGVLTRDDVDGVRAAFRAAT